MSQFFAEAEVLIRPNTTGFAAALVTKVNEEVLAAQKAIKPMVVGAVVAPAGGALKGQGAIFQSVSSNTGALAGANLKLSEAGTKTADAMRNVGRETQRTTGFLSRHKAQLGQVEKAASATAAGMLGLRGAVLTAGTAFIAVVAGLQAAKKAVGEASALNEEINKTDVVFGKSATAILEWSKTTASAMGISRVAALTAANQFGNILVPLGVLPEKAAVLSESLVRLASDMASFNNVSPERALNALQSGLVGQSRPLRVLGVQLTAARVQMEAMRETGKKQASEITQQEKVLARYTLILKDAAIQAGDYAATQDRLANSGRRLKAEIADLGAALGGGITPELTRDVRGLNVLLGALSSTINRFQGYGAQLDTASKSQSYFSRVVGETAKLLYASSSILGTIGVQFGSSGAKVSSSIEDMNVRLRKLQDDLKGLTGPAGVALLSIKLQDLIAAFARGGPAGKQFATVLAGILADLQTGKLKVNTKLDLVAIFDQGQARAEVEKKWGIARDSIERGLVLTPIKAKVDVEIQAAVHAADVQSQIVEQVKAGVVPGGRSALEDALRAAIAAQQHIIDTAKVGSKRYRDALREKAALMGELKSLTDQDAADAKTKGDQIKTAREKAVQAFIDSFTPKQQGLENRVTTASLSKPLKDDLAANQALLKFFVAERKAIVARIKAMHLHGDALKIAQQAIAAINQSIFTTRNAIAQLSKQQAANAKEQRQAAIDARQAHLEAMLAIAETTTPTIDDRKALNALIAFDKTQIARINAIKKKRKLTLEEQAQLDGYKVDLAQRNKALKDLTKEAQKGNTFAQQAFAFLQTQQGFVSNLLGNLIPGGLTGGLVGGGGGGGAGGGGLRPVSGGFEQPRGGSPSVSGGGGGGVVFDLAAGTAGAKRTTPPPPTMGQANTQISILRQIRDLLLKLNRGTEHPEAKNQRAGGAAAMDYARSGMGMGIG